MKTRRSPKNQQRLYNDIGKQLRRAAGQEPAPARKRGPLPTKADVAAARRTDDAGRDTQMLLIHRTEMKKMVRFTASQEWATGAVNATVYVPKAMAEGVTSVVVTIER